MTTSRIYDRKQGAEKIVAPKILMPDHYCVHHRKPIVIGGEDTERNKSNVLRSNHNYWHGLYKVMDAQDIIKQFKEDCEIYGTWWTTRSVFMQSIVEKVANSTDERIKRRVAWYGLFAGITLELIVKIVNGIWLDPDYQIIIGTERVIKVFLGTTIRNM